MTHPSRGLLTYALWGLVLIGGANVLYFQQAIAMQLHEWQVLPQAERLSELYFSEPTTLHQLAKGKAQPLTFTVHNLEQENKDYAYKLFYYVPAGKKQLVATGNIDVGHTEMRRVTELISLPALPQALAVEVQLLYRASFEGQQNKQQQTQTQTIQYWIR